MDEIVFYSSAVACPNVKRHSEVRMTILGCKSSQVEKGVILAAVFGYPLAHKQRDSLSLSLFYGKSFLRGDGV